MVAAAKLRRAEDRAKTAKPYSDRLQSFLSRLDVGQDNIPHPLAHIRPHIRNTGIIIITSDKGLCGSFNSNIIRKAKAWLADKDESNMKVYIVGRKGVSTLKKSGLNIEEKYINLDQSLDYKEIKGIADRVSNDFMDEKIDECYILYSLYKSPAICFPTIDRLLPVGADEGSEENADGAHSEYIIEPSPEAVLKILFPKFVYTKLVMGLANSFASEHGQRMVAMTNATDAARDMVESLTLRYNKARQSAITTEISEIVGGSEALKS